MPHWLLIGFLVFQQAHSVSLAWDRNVETFIAGYNVYRSATAGQYSAASKVNPSIVPQPPAGTIAFTDGTVAQGHTYFYVVTAVNTDGLESGYSNEVKAIITNPAPAAPTGLTVKGISTASIVIDGVKVASAPIGDLLSYAIPRQAPPRSYSVSVAYDPAN